MNTKFTHVHICAFAYTCMLCIRMRLRAHAYATCRPKKSRRHQQGHSTIYITHTLSLSHTHTYKQANNQTNKQTSKHTSKQASKQANKQTHTHKHTHSHLGPMQSTFVEGTWTCSGAVLQLKPVFGMQAYWTSGFLYGSLSPRWMRAQPDSLHLEIANAQMKCRIDKTCIMPRCIKCPKKGRKRPCLVETTGLCDVYIPAYVYGPCPGQTKKGTTNSYTFNKVPVLPYGTEESS